MDRMKAVVAAAVLAMVIAMVGVLWASSLDSRDSPGRPLLAQEGPGLDDHGDEPLRLSNLDGPAPTWAHGTVPGDTTYIVIKVDVGAIMEARLLGFDPPPTTPHPDEDTLLIAYDARDTNLGCTADLMPSLGPPGLWLLDVCHHGQFNALDSGAPRPNTPHDGPLDTAKVLLDTGPDPQILVR